MSLTAHAVDYDQKVFFLVVHVVGAASGSVPTSNGSYSFAKARCQATRRRDHRREAIVISCEAPVHP